MSGVLVPDDEGLIDDTPRQTTIDKAAGGLRPEVLVWHMRTLGLLVVLIGIVLVLLFFSWRRFGSVLRRMQNVDGRSAEMPESPTTRGLRERLDRKKKR